MTLKAKEIDIKSLIIGFLLATIIFLALGASSGTQDVRIVGISTYDNLRIKVEKIDSSVELPVKVTDVNSSVKLPVKIAEVDYLLEIPVKIKDQPIDVLVK